MPARSVYVCSACKTRIPFGTEAKSAPGRCPGCGRKLSIPMDLDESAWVKATCPSCSTEFRTLAGRFGGRHCACPKCGWEVDVPM